MTWIILLLTLLALLYFEVGKPITLLLIGGLLLLFSLTHWSATASVVIFLGNLYPHNTSADVAVGTPSFNHQSLNALV